MLFNGKFDLHWLKRYSIRFEHVLVYDCQLHEFIVSNQLTRFPSLNQAAARFGLGEKIDVVERDYWSQGIDTPDIPKSVIYPYTEQDLILTEQVYLRQIAEITDPKVINLIRLHNADLLVLQEMEYNGILFQWDEMRLRRDKLQAELEVVREQLGAHCGNWEYFNWSSGDHLSCLLYGGTVNVDVATPYEHTFKAGPNAGKTAVRNKWTTVTRTYPRLTEPVRGSELKKEGYWSTDEGNLKQLKGCKDLVGLLLKQAEIGKLISTYYEGIPKLIEEYDWKDGLVHGQLNQCVVVTGRLSASKPNQQNLVVEVQECIVSRWP